MASKKQKRKNKANTRAAQIAYQAESMKTYTGGGYGYFGSSHVQPDMRADEWGASQAYTFNVAVSAAIEFWELWLDGIQWRICSEADDRVLIDSNMRRFPRAIDGGKFAHAIKFHEQCFKHSLFKSIAFSDMMYGESYIHFIPNDWGLADKLEWMNPLAVEPNIMQGRIRDYRYSADEGYQTLSPKEVAYRIAKRDSQNDLRGQSRVLAAIDALNLEAAQKRSLKSYFKNGMNLGGLISPTDPNASLSPVQVQQLEDTLERKHKGAANAGKMAIAPSNMQIEMFPAVDIQDNYNIIKPLRDEILMAMGVYPQLAGDPSDANYDSAYDIKRQWWETRGIPYAKEIEGFINDLILPILEPYTNVYFEFDFTPYEVEKPEVINADLSAGMIDLYDAAERRGYEGDEQLKGIYIINGMPMSKQVIVKLANAIPSQYALDMAQADKAESEADAVVSTPETPALPSGTPLPEGWTEEPAVGNEEAIEAALNTEIASVGHKHHDHSHDFPEIVETPDIEALDELAAWKKFVTNGKAQKRAFDPVALRGDIGDALQSAVDSHDKQTILDAFKAAATSIETRVKAIQATRLDFENSVEDIMSKALASNNYGRQQWATAMRKIIRYSCTRAYVDGLVNGGVLDGKLSESDQDTLTSHIANQSQYVTNLGEEIFKTEDGISEAVADRKPTLWFNKSVMPMYDAGQLSADGNRMMEFAGHDGEENCPTCKRLKGQRHRHQDWARKGLRPDAIEDSDNFECGLWECNHHLVPVSARERGNW